MKLDILRKCVLVRGGLEIWIEAEKADRLYDTIKNPQSPKYIKIDEQVINTFEIIGIMTPDAMEERQRRKNGQWKCMKGNWHDKGNVCECSEHKETVTATVEGIGEVTYKR